MVANAQTFWLDNLKEADHYNQWIFEQIRSYLGSNILEIGCGNGNFTGLLAKSCNHVLAVDLDAEYVQIANQRLAHCGNVEIQCADATQLPQTQKFDSIVMLDVLEHIEHDAALLRQLSRQLEPKGTFIVKVPALQWLYGPMDEVIGHYRRYHKEHLSQVFIEAGFQPPQIWPFNIAGIPGWWLNGKVLKQTTPPSQQVGAFNRVVPILRSLESLVQPPLGLSLFAVAKLSKSNK